MNLLRESRYGLRVLAKSPGFSLAAIVTVALGISVNTTVFTLVNGVFFAELPFESPEEVAYIRASPSLSYPDFRDLRDQSRTLRLGAFAGLGADLSDGVGTPERVPAASISANTFSILGRQALVGRDFVASDEEPGSDPVALIGYGLWQTRYGGDPDIAGQSIRVNLRDYTIIGVLPEEEGFPNSTALWLPLVPADPADRTVRNVQLFGRLNSGFGFTEAQAELDTMVTRLLQEYPETNENTQAFVVPFRERSVGGPIPVVFGAMMGAVAFVLLIACANVANLLLSRVVERTRESSIRVAVGASRWAIARQSLVESVMLSFAGGIVGLGLAYLGVAWFTRAVANTGPPYWLTFDMDYRVFAYFAGICLVAGVLFGLAPALQVSKTNVVDNLKEGARGSSGGSRSRRLTSILIVGEIGMTVVLLVGAGLFVRSFLNMQSFDLGVNRAGVLTAAISLPPVKYADNTSRMAFADGLNQRLQAIPGPDGVALASNIPAGGGMVDPIRIRDRDVSDSDGAFPPAARLAVSPEYFDALGLGMISGRSFTSADGRAGSEVAIVDEMFADIYWPGEDPVGRQIQVVSKTEDEHPWLTVVGVSPRVYQTGDEDDTDPEARANFYVPLAQEPRSDFAVVVRSGLATEALTGAIRDAMRQLDGDLPLFNIQTLEERLRQRNWPFRVFGSLFATFAMIALVMSAVGIYGVTAYGVNQRTREFGVRVALGASQRSILWLVFKQGLRRVAVGLAIGLFAAWGVSRVLESILYEVTPDDPVTFGAISLFLAAVTLAACLVPARRAVRLDPVDALRAD